jgi:hypothetical protein
MVRDKDSHNCIFTAVAEGGVAELKQFFQFTGLHDGIVGDFPNPPHGLHVPTLPGKWIIDWRRYHKVLLTNPAGVPLNPSRKIDPFVLPAASVDRRGSLPFRNLKRGARLGLRSGQDVARAMKIQDALTLQEITKGADGAAANKHHRHTNTPLSYYILKEAEQRGNGGKLGPVGGTLLAEVFLGLVHGEHRSCLWQRARTGSRSCLRRRRTVSPWPTCCALWGTSVRSTEYRFSSRATPAEVRGNARSQSALRDFGSGVHRQDPQNTVPDGQMAARQTASVPASEYRGCLRRSNGPAARNSIERSTGPHSKKIKIINRRMRR